MRKSLKIIFMMGLVLFMGLISANVSFAQYDYRYPIPEERGFKHSPLQKSAIKGEHRPPNRADFEKRLNLTQEQKDIAKVQREKSIAKIKPLIEHIDAKKARVEALSPEKDAELIGKLENEIRVLRKQCHEIRRENMRAFEDSLSDEQRREMHKMKEEGRKRFEQHNKILKNKLSY